MFDVLRHRRRYAHLAQGMRGPLPQRLARLSLASRLGVPALQAAGGADEDVRAALERALSVDPASLAQAVRLSLPDWLHEALRAECGSAQTLEAPGMRMARRSARPWRDCRVKYSSTLKPCGTGKSGR